MAKSASRHSGWLTFAGVMLAIAGALNVIHGITAIHNDNYFTSQLLYNNLSAWGWVFLMNLPVVVIGLVAVTVLVPESRAASRPGLDPAGIVTSCGGLAILIYGFIAAGQ